VIPRGTPCRTVPKGQAGCDGAEFVPRVGYHSAETPMAAGRRPTDPGRMKRAPAVAFDETGGPSDGRQHDSRYGNLMATDDEPVGHRHRAERRSQRRQPSGNLIRPGVGVQIALSTGATYGSPGKGRPRSASFMNARPHETSNRAENLERVEIGGDSKRGGPCRIPATA
jgi:hypothetical protein